MISEELVRREERAKRVCGWMAGVYIAVGVGLAVMYMIRKDWYLMAQSLGTILALAAMMGMLKLIGIRPVWSYYAVIIAFTFAAYTLGVACAWYKTAPGYDKLLHMLSGTLTMMLALPLFCALKSDHQVARKDSALTVAFCLFAALAVAGVWELAEYFLSMAIHTDPQCVQATGVADTMQDMIVCALGALAAVPALIGYCRGKRRGFLFAPVEVFVERNLRGYDEHKKEWGT